MGGVFTKCALSKQSMLHNTKCYKCLESFYNLHFETNIIMYVLSGFKDLNVIKTISGSPGVRFVSYCKPLTNALFFNH